jgi:hypothetical protein
VCINPMGQGTIVDNLSPVRFHTYTRTLVVKERQTMRLNVRTPRNVYHSVRVLFDTHYPCIMQYSIYVRVCGGIPSSELPAILPIHVARCTRGRA